MLEPHHETQQSGGEIQGHGHCDLPGGCCQGLTKISSEQGSESLERLRTLPEYAHATSDSQTSWHTVFLQLLLAVDGIMSWTSPDSWVTRLFSGDPWIILLALLVALSLPILLHLYFYTTSRRAAITPTFLLLGPSGSGKTSLLSIVGSFVGFAPSTANIHSFSDDLPTRKQMQRTPGHRKRPLRSPWPCRVPFHWVRTNTGPKMTRLCKTPKNIPPYTR